MGAQRKRRILIVDDEPEICRSTAFMFMAYGFETETATGGFDAIDLLWGDPVGFGLVLSDIRMPAGTGLDLLEATRAMADPPLVLLCTGFADMTEEEALELGARGLVSKPMHFDELLVRIEALLGEVG